MTMAMIRIHYADGRVQDCPLSPGRYRIGRDAGEIVLGDPNTSAHHADLFVEPGRVGIGDAGSTNGTLDMAGNRLTAFHALNPGEWVRLGNCGITLLSIASVASVGGAIAPPAPRPVTVPMQVPAAVPMPLPSPVQAQAPAYAMASYAGANPYAGAGNYAGGYPVAGGYERGPVGAGASAHGSGSASAYSHPDEPVRHSYPVAQTAFGLGGAMQLLVKTAPFLFARLATLVAVSTVGLIYWIVVVAGFVFLGHKTAVVAWVWFVFAASVAGWFWRVVVRSFLYLLKMGHIAVLTELVTKGQIGNGSEGMFSYGKRVVVERFGEIAALFVVDALISGVVGAFNRTLDWVSNLIPIPGLQSVVGFVKAVIRACTRYIAETIFSYNLARGDSNVFASSKDGLIYYAQNAKEILKTGIWVVILERVLSFAVFVVVFLPALAFAYALPSAWGGWLPLTAIVAGVLYAGNVREAVLRPLFLTMILLKFHSTVRGQAINPQWDARLQTASDKFRELTTKAAQWVAAPPVQVSA
jgi:FHA domain